MTTDTIPDHAQDGWTPGPWVVRSKFVGPLEIVRDLPDHALEPIALVGADTFRECAANAELIAAAPDMLAALKAAKEVLEWDDDHPSIYVEPYKLIVAAIAKAEGRQP